MLQARDAYDIRIPETLTRKWRVRFFTACRGYGCPDRLHLHSADFHPPIHEI